MVVLLLDGILVLLFVAGYAARYVHPRHLWWLQLIAIGLPYLGMMVLGGTALVAVAGPRQLLTLHLALCLLLAVRFLPLARFSGSAAATAGATQAGLTVMTFNIWPKHPQVENWRATNALFQNERPDLAALQEMPAWFSATEFMTAPVNVPVEIQADSAQYLATPLDVPPDCRSGQVVLSRIALDEQDQVPIAEHPDGCANGVRVRLRWQGQDVVLYSIHLRSFQDKPWRDPEAQWWKVGGWQGWFRSLQRDFLARAEEADKVAALLRMERGPVILCGDLNSTPHNWVYRRVGEGMTDAFGARPGWGWGATYHSRFPLARIDFVFVSPEWRVVSARVPEVALSDHLPLIVRLALRERP